MSDSNDNSQKKKRSAREWESAVEKTLREAVERGEFDNLPGKGKPQNLEPNPFVPEEMRQAFRILENAGVAPDWIELDKEIRAAKAELAATLERQARWLQEQTARSRSFAPDRLVTEYERLVRLRDQSVARFRERARDLNKTIDVFNLKAPSGTLHHARIPIEHEIQNFLDACKT